MRAFAREASRFGFDEKALDDTALAVSGHAKKVDTSTGGREIVLLGRPFRGMDVSVVGAGDEKLAQVRIVAAAEVALQG